MTTLDRSSRNRLTERLIPQFAGDPLFDSIARAVCRAGRLPGKERYEAWEVARRVRRRFRGGRIVDLAASHGLLAAILLLLDDTSPDALVVDRRIPKSAASLAASLTESWPRLQGRLRFVETDLEDVPLRRDDLIVSVHACGGLTDLVIERAIVTWARVAAVGYSFRVTLAGLVLTNKNCFRCCFAEIIPLFSKPPAMQVVCDCVVSGQDGVLRLALPLSRLDAAMGSVGAIIGAALLIAVVFALFLSYVIANITSRPLRNMASAASHIGRGNFGYRFPVAASDEIGELAGIMNEMTAKIEDQIEKMSAERNRLVTILRGMGEGVIVTDQEGKVTLANPAFRILFSLGEEIEGR